MLSQEENELLTRVGPGTPMGNLMRRYWVPALLSEELPTPDCPPIRVRLLGEDLVAFRDTNGEVGLIAANCPHRGASLFFGRNEECGIRCVYHGWKFDVTGQCVDMPSEPAESNFKAKIKATAYPARDRGGLIWAYLGPPEKMPGLPEFEWANLPTEHRHLTKRSQDCNWLQTVEGGIDSSHSSFLHSGLPPGKRMAADTAQGFVYKLQDTSPRFEVLETEYGLLIGARRDAEGDNYYWRITQWLMPWNTMIPPYGNGALTGHSYVPMDDEHCWAFGSAWHPTRPFTPEEHARMQERDRTNLIPGTWRPIANKDNDYLIDREKQRTENFTGIDQRISAAEDRAMTEGMGPIMDRTKEHLGASDTAIIAARQQLLKAVRNLEQGIDPPGVAADTYRVRAHAIVLPKDTPFAEGAREGLAARPGTFVASV